MDRLWLKKRLTVGGAGLSRSVLRIAVVCTVLAVAASCQIKASPQSIEETIHLPALRESLFMGALGLRWTDSGRLRLT